MKGIFFKRTVFRSSLLCWLCFCVYACICVWLYMYYTAMQHTYKYLPCLITTIFESAILWSSESEKKHKKHKKHKLNLHPLFCRPSTGCSLQHFAQNYIIKLRLDTGSFPRKLSQWDWIEWTTKDSMVERFFRS